MGALSLSTSVYADPDVTTITCRAADAIGLMLQTSLENVLMLAGGSDRREDQALSVLSELVAQAGLQLARELAHRKRIDPGLSLSLVLSDVEVRMRQSRACFIAGPRKQ